MSRPSSQRIKSYWVGACFAQWVGAGRGGCLEILLKSLSLFRLLCSLLFLALFLSLNPQAKAVILWSDLGYSLAHETGDGVDILGGALHEDGVSTNTLYFKFRVDPLSDVGVEPYFAAFQFYEGNTERMAVGNSPKAWAYSVFNTSTTGASNRVYGDLDLNSSRPEPSGPGSFFRYEFPRRGFESTFVFKVEYVPGDDAYVTLYLNPDLSPGASEQRQDTNLITHFRANASFIQIHLRHGGGGGGWSFNDMAIATAFNDFVSENGFGQEGTSFTFRPWQREQGLPLGAVHAIAQTKNGYLWLGGDAGVARFDGVRFVFLGSRAGLGAGCVRALLGDATGALWVGSSGAGLTRLAEGKSTIYSSRQGLPSDNVTCLAEDAQNHLWIGTDAGLSAYFDSVLAPLRSMRQFDGCRVNRLFRDRNGSMWVCVAGRGVFQMQGDKFVAVSDPTVEKLLLNPHCILVDQSNRLWIGAGDDFVLCRDGAQWLRYQLPHHFGTPYVAALAEEPDGTVWAGSVSEGLFRFRDGKLTSVPAGGGLSDNQVESLFVDQEGKLWVGTDAGLNRIHPKPFVAFGQNQGLGQEGAVQGLAEAAPGVVWAGKPGGGLYRLAGRSFSRVLKDLPADKDSQIGSLITLSGQLEKSQNDTIELDPKVNTLLQARDGSCWVGTTDGLIQFRKPAALRPQPERTQFPNESFLSLAEDGEGLIWAGTLSGHVWRRKGEVWTEPGGEEITHPVTALTEDGQGGMWVGTDGEGLLQFSKDRRRQFRKESGGLESDSILALHRDSHDALWIGTAGGGLSRLYKGQFASFTTREGLPDNTISQIIEDADGTIWLGSDKGVASISHTDFREFLLGSSRSLHPRLFGHGDGMPSEKCTGGYSPSGLRTANGLLFFATSKGVAMLDPKSKIAEVLPPRVLLEEVLLDGEPSSGIALQSLMENSREIQGLRIPAGRHRIEFRYTGLGYNEPERVRFRYRLDGLDSDWVEAGENGTRRNASYGYVPPGSYRFKVSACNEAGVWNPVGAEVNLMVDAYFWQSWWFITFGILALLSAIVVGVRIQEKAKIKRHLAVLEQERAVQHERARIARDLHDDLGSSLTRISLLSGLVRADKEHPALVETHTEKISQSAEQTVRALDEIVWAVRPGSDSLQSLVEYISHFANELFEGDGARCRLDFPQKLPARPLPPEVRHDIFLVVKEALTNARKHSKATEVRIQASMNGDMLNILVQDNGCGFDSNKSSGDSVHNGLGNMKRRAAGMGGKLTVHSTPEKGTQIGLSILVPDKPDNMAA